MGLGREIRQVAQKATTQKQPISIYLAALLIFWQGVKLKNYRVLLLVYINARV